jgi:hypothetical protein
LPGALTEGGGDVGMAAEPQQRHQTVSQGSEILRRVAAANPTGVLLESHITHVVQAVLDAPVTSPPGQQGAGRGLGAWNAGDGILRLGVFLPLAARDANQPADLSGSGPIEVTGQAIGCLQPTVCPATAFLVACLGNIKMRNAPRFGRRGKKPP